MDTIYQHFRPDEKEFIDQVLSWRLDVENSYVPKLSDFLDPRELQIVQTIIGKNNEIKCAAYGGTDNAERQRAIIFPDYFQPDVDDFQLTLFQLKYASKFLSIGHRQILGTLMSLGVKREKFGDILIQEDNIQLIVAKEMAHYVQLQFDQVGKASVELVEIPLEEVIQPKNEWKMVQKTVSSLRLDAVLSAFIHVSRQKARTLILSEKVKVNWKHVSEPAFLCEENDTISIRGFGRCKIMTLRGTTKKGKWRIEVGKLK